MKRIVFFIVAAVMLMGCEDFLEHETLVDKTTENFPQTAEDAQQMMAGIYTTMNNAQRFPVKTFFYVSEVASDDKLGGGGANDYETHAIDNLMTYGPDMLDHPWDMTYEGIYRVNLALENLDQLDAVGENQKNQFLGEAYFLRAWFYYQLTSVFGGVPLTISSEAENLPAASIDEIYGQIASDLKTAIEIMPDWTYDQIEDGHATRWAAQALMARVYLFYTGFYNQSTMPLADGGTVTSQNVIDWLNDCINNSGHHLVSDFHELWAYTNAVTIGDYDYIQDYMAETGKDLKYASDGGANNPESMFVLKFNNFADWGVKRGYSNQYMLYFALRGLQPLANTFPFAGGWGQGNSVPHTLVEQWEADEPDDPRLWASVIDIEEELIPKGYKRGQWDFVQETDYWGKKYNGISARTEDGGYVNDYSVIMHNNNDNNQLSHIDDLIYIRFADVLLMMSELTEDAQYMNQVRARADLDPVAYSLENIQKERRYELAFEGLRWNDMRRWGESYTVEHLETQAEIPVYYYGQPDINYVQSSVGYGGRYSATKGFFPIPTSQIQLSEGQLSQPDGWDTPGANFSGWTNN